MNSPWMFPVWIAMYFFSYIITPWNKLGNGYTGRIFFRWVPRNWRYVVRYMAWWGITLVPILMGIPNYVFWIVAIAFIVDDYYFGDDDERKKRWDLMKNKIKWLMDLPPVPVEVKDAA